MTNARQAPAVSSAALTLSNEQRLLFVSGINRGLSANAILEASRAANLPIGRSRGLQAINELASTIGNGVGIQKTAPSLTPSLSVFRPSAFIPTGTFRVWATYDTGNDLLNNGGKLSAVFTFDDLMKREDIDAAIFDILGNAAEAYGFSLDPGALTYTTAEIGL